MIMSLLTTGLIITMAIMGAAILWDSGLRWMSALAQLQRQLKEIDQPVMGLRPQASARFVSAAATYSVTKRSTPRAAA